MVSNTSWATYSESPSNERINRKNTEEYYVGSEVLLEAVRRHMVEINKLFIAKSIAQGCRIYLKNNLEIQKNHLLKRHKKVFCSWEILANLFF